MLHEFWISILYKLLFVWPHDCPGVRGVRSNSRHSLNTLFDIIGTFGRNQWVNQNNHQFLIKNPIVIITTSYHWELNKILDVIFGTFDSKYELFHGSFARIVDVFSEKFRRKYVYIFIKILEKFREMFGKLKKLSYLKYFWRTLETFYEHYCILFFAMCVLIGTPGLRPIGPLPYPSHLNS